MIINSYSLKCYFLKMQLLLAKKQIQHEAQNKHLQHNISKKFNEDIIKETKTMYTLINTKFSGL